LFLIVHQTSDERQRRRDEKSIGFDFIGFLLVATFLGTFEVVLDRGQQEDWFASNFIVTCTAVGGLALLIMIPWEITRRNPIVDVRMIATRQYGACFLAMIASGAILITTAQFVPLLVQQNFGYTATLAGLILSPGGLVQLLIMLLAVGRMSRYVQPKYMIAIGASIVAVSMYGLTNLYSGVDYWFFASSRMYIGIGLPLMIPMITMASYDGIARARMDQAAALITVARNIGGSFGVSLGNNVLAHRAQFHQSRLTELVTPSGVAYQETLKQVSDYFVGSGSSMLQAYKQAFEWISQQVQLQASLMAYIDVFWTLMVISAATVPLALALRNIKLGAGTRRVAD
jgi:MFS transporter, DHA2 family, multidrug resistance protein